MDKPRGKINSVPAAKRGHLIQRVLVDGWTISQAAAAAGVTERRVERWIADYRRNGMASLRDGDPYTERLHRRMWRKCCAGLQRGWGVFMPRLRGREKGDFIVLNRPDERRTGP